MKFIYENIEANNTRNKAFKMCKFTLAKEFAIFERILIDVGITMHKQKNPVKFKKTYTTDIKTLKCFYNIELNSTSNYTDSIFKRYNRLSYELIRKILLHNKPESIYDLAILIYNDDTHIYNFTGICAFLFRLFSKCQNGFYIYDEYPAYDTIQIVKIEL